MKLKKLLDKHKDNLWDGGYNQLVIDNGAWENYKGIIIDGRVNDNPMSEFSLADILFSTPFLSLLERKELLVSSNAILDNCVIYDYNRPQYRPDYHKINLVLLNTDAERISYIENNTI